MNKQLECRIVRDDAREFERVVFAEVLVPNTYNVYSDFCSPEIVRLCAYEFARQGYGLDVEHDQVDVRNDKYYVVESFIAREGDTDFIAGSWVVGVKIVDDDLWQDVLDNEINGFSFEADMFYTEGSRLDLGERIITGYTEADPFDGHTHVYTVVIDGKNKVISGGTSMTDGHMHTITSHTITNKASGHSHRWQLVEGYLE